VRSLTLPTMHNTVNWYVSKPLPIEVSNEIDSGETMAMGGFGSSGIVADVRSPEIVARLVAMPARIALIVVMQHRPRCAGTGRAWR